MVGRWERGEVGGASLRYGSGRFDTILGESIVETAMMTMLCLFSGQFLESRHALHLHAWFRGREPTIRLGSVEQFSYNCGSGCTGRSSGMVALRYVEFLPRCSMQCHVDLR